MGENIRLEGEDQQGTAIINFEGARTLEKGLVRSQFIPKKPVSSFQQRNSHISVTFLLYKIPQ
jgi:hypothetical protein